MTTDEQIKEIKRSFHLMMNGVASQSMRDKGLDYHVNWGVPFPQLKEMAAPLGKDFHLALGLWKDNVRECKILATLVMPYEEMDEDLAELWMDSIQSQELAEMLAFNLLQHCACGPRLAFRWIASDNDARQICGYGIIARRLMGGSEPTADAVNELIDQATAAIKGGTAGVVRAAHNALTRLADTSEVNRRLVERALRQG